jgi:Tol biopolymer transport system component
MSRRTFVTVSVLLAMLGGVVPAAEATFPGGNGRIALEMSSASGADEWRGYIVTINIDGSDPRTLAGGQDPTVQDPAYSPDGDRIAFTRYRQVDTLPIWVEDEYFVKFFTGIFVMRSDGSGKRRLIAGPYRDPDWSPDGSRLVLTRTQKPRGILIWRRGRLRRLVSGASPAWSPTGRLIAFTGSDGIYVVRPDGTGMRRLVADRLAHHPEWSPDGRRVLFTRGVNSWYPGYSHGTTSRSISMYSIRPSGTGLRRVSSVYGRNPVYSPDGTLISYARHINYSTDSILTMRENGEERTRIFTLADDELGLYISTYSPLHVAGLSWQPLPGAGP